MIDRLLFRVIHWGSKRTDGVRVFLSYAHEDEQAVSGLASDLRFNGVEVWFAPKHLKPGERLSSRIQKAIKQADFVLLAVTSRSRNSLWVASEIEFALRQEPRGLTVVPLYLTSRAVPEQLADHKAIDIRRFVYKAGLRELLDQLYGRLPAGRTPLGEFERFVASLPVFDDEIQKAVDSYVFERAVMARNPTLYSSKHHTDELANRLDACKRLLTERNYGDYNTDRILETLSRGVVPPALQDSELQQLKEWLRLGHPETLALAATLYESRFVRWPSCRRILKSDIQHQIRAWVSRGEIPDASAPTTEWLIDRLVEERLIRPFRKDDYISEPTEDFQEFHWEPRLTSVGKAAYLYERDHPDRPHANYPIGRYPGSSPSHQSA
ncbi:toll/interleukin-1 receptor domain-containing protein [Nitrospira sp. Nam80]